MEVHEIGEKHESDKVKGVISIRPMRAWGGAKKLVACCGGADIVRPLFPKENSMSQHRSLKGTGAIVAKRNVLKRFERVEVLQKRGVFKPGQKVIGLPKTKPIE